MSGNSTTTGTGTLSMAHRASCQRNYLQDVCQRCLTVLEQRFAVLEHNGEHITEEEWIIHTELFAALTNTKKYTMMLAHGELRVVHVSTHLPLSEAIKLVKRERILDVIKIANDTCLALGISKPKVAVAGLNPHAGDGGLLGKEEIEETMPAIEDARKLGIDAKGPVPADVVFSQARGGWFDIVVAMYHDQGHIPSKFAGFVYDKNKNEWGSVSGVNVTLGIPIIRASVDHGVAFGKAGKGTARPDSLMDAITIAVSFVENKSSKPALASCKTYSSLCH